MAWIESHQSLSRHRKTLRLAAALKTDRHKVIGHLHELWWWAVDNADIQGFLPQCTNVEIADAAGWPTRDADRFVEALLSAGFIDRDDVDESALSLHDWYEYAGKLNQKRAENRERMRAKREHPEPPHDPRTNGTLALHVQRTTDARAPATVPTVHTVPTNQQTEPEEDDYSVGAAVNGVPRPIRKSPRANGTNPRAIGTNPRAQIKVAAVIDAFRALKIEPVLTGRDFKAIKDTTASPGLIAEVYDAVARREYGDAFMQKRLSVHEAIEWVNGYSEWKWEGQHGKDFEEPAVYDTLAPCVDCGKSCTAKWLEEHQRRCSDCWRRARVGVAEGMK